MGNGINTQGNWWAKGTRRRHGIGQEPSNRLAPFPIPAETSSRVFVQQGTRRASAIHPGPDGQHPVGGRRCKKGGRALRGGAISMDQVLGAHFAEETAQPRPGAWVANNRSPATTRRISRWPTARTFSWQDAPLRRCPWEVYPSLALRQPFSTTRAAGGRAAFSTRVKGRRARGPQPGKVQSGRPRQARRVPEPACAEGGKKRRVERRHAPRPKEIGPRTRRAGQRTTRSSQCAPGPDNGTSR